MLFELSVIHPFYTFSVLALVIIPFVVYFRRFRKRKMSLYDQIVEDYYKAEKLQFKPHVGDEESIRGKIAIVTGANVGIGRATAVELAKRGARVIMACRDLTKSEKALNEMQLELGHETKDNLILMHLDLGDLGSVRKFASEFDRKFPRLHLLINNGGVYDRSGRRLPPTQDGFEPHFGINYLGHFLLTQLLLKNLKASAPSRIVTLTSLTYALSNMTRENISTILSPGGTIPSLPDAGHYANSKYANILFTKELGVRLGGTNVNTYAVCPGLVQTDMTRHENWFIRQLTRVFMTFRGLTPEEGCQTVLMCALSKKVAAETGGMYRFGRNWTNTLKDIDVGLMNELWELSEAATMSNVQELSQK